MHLFFYLLILIENFNFISKSYLILRLFIIIVMFRNIFNYNHKLRNISKRNSYSILRSFTSSKLLNNANNSGDSDQNKQLADETINLKQLTPQPSFTPRRIILWDQFKQRYESELAAKIPQNISVYITDKSGEIIVLNGESWRTTPLQLAMQIGSKEWSESLLIAKVNDILWDLDRVLESECSVKFLTFEQTEAREVFWHSSAHVLGEALERLYDVHIGYGEPIDSGFYYDVLLSDGSVRNERLNTISKTVLNSIESVMKSCCFEAQPFERLELTNQELFQMFSYSRFKNRFIKENIKEERTTVYRCGTFIDLCTGPHVRHTGIIKSLKVTNSATGLWEENEDTKCVQRIYGISLPDQKQLKEWQSLQKGDKFYLCHILLRELLIITKSDPKFKFIRLFPISQQFIIRNSYFMS